MADRPVLVCIEGALAGSVFPVPEGGMEIGRSPENDVVLEDDDGVSRFHARLQYDDGALWVRDAGSRNGVYVNDTRIGRHKALKVGDRIGLGVTVFEVQWEADSDSRRARTADRKPWFWPFGSDERGKG
ncbi:MAG: FHA domain-containing protein [Alphaproteobacteria bacterium]|nr:FHA domain-containing protein [Alphaproteobacteria bacterium]